MSKIFQLADKRIDELNIIRTRIYEAEYFENGKRKFDRKKLYDTFFELLILAYKNGVEYANEQLGTEEPTDYDLAVAVVEKEIGGKTLEKRINDWVDRIEQGEEPKGLPEPTEETETPTDDTWWIRITDTESTRDFGEGEMQVGRKHATTKTWHTMMDERVRDTHDFLEGVSVPIDAMFYSYDGDSADSPGNFLMPENNINCRCYLTFNK